MVGWVWVCPMHLRSFRRQHTLEMILTSVVEMQELGETSVMSPKPWLGTLHSHICLGPGGQSQVTWPDSKLARWRGGEVSSAPGAGGMSVCWAGRRSIAGCVVDLCFLSSHEEPSSVSQMHPRGCGHTSPNPARCSEPSVSSPLPPTVLAMGAKFVFCSPLP